MTTFEIHKIYYTPGVDVLTFAVQAVDGPFRGQLIDLYGSQDNLQQRAAARGAVAWDDVDARAAVSELLAPMGAELTDPAEAMERE